MSKTRKTVQPHDIIAMNEAYIKIGTYAGAGRETGWSGSTVKRYIIADYVPQSEQKPIVKEEFVIPSSDYLQFPSNWEKTLQLSEEELSEIVELQKTISL